MRSPSALRRRYLVIALCGALLSSAYAFARNPVAPAGGPLAPSGVYGAIAAAARQPVGELPPVAELPPSVPAAVPGPRVFEEKIEPQEPQPDPKAKDAAKPLPQPSPLYDSLHLDDDYGLKSLFDSLHPKGERGKWYEKINIRGYTQFRFGRILSNRPDDVSVGRFGDADPTGVPITLFGDRSITGRAEDFSVRRARFILFGDVTPHLGVYAQVDAANTPPGSSTATMFAQMRDLYGDVYIDTTKIHRFRVGLSKVPFGWENMQSSQNRVPLDRTDPINSGVSPNERDLGVFYYWTPEEKQQLLRDLVDGGLKGSGNYGIFGIGVYNGQGGSQLEQNRNLHTVARLTWPVQLANGQVVEASIQGYTGETVVAGAPIRALGAGNAITPAGTLAAGDARGHRDQRVAGTFVWYPQPFGFQAEWNVGEGPGLNDEQTAVTVRRLHGGYVMAMYKIDTPRLGIFTPYTRFQYYRGGYKSVVNAPFGTTSEWDLGIEWQIRKEMELVVEYNFLDNVSLNAVNQAGARSYQNFTGSALRCQFQINY